MTSIKKIILKKYYFFALIPLDIIKTIIPMQKLTRKVTKNAVTKFLKVIKYNILPVSEENRTTSPMKLYTIVKITAKRRLFLIQGKNFSFMLLSSFFKIVFLTLFNYCSIVILL